MMHGLATASIVAATLASEPGRDRFELVKVAHGVYAAVARKGFPLNCNAAVIVNESDVLVVDTHGTPGAAQGLIRQIRRITSLPIRTVVNTHFHGDHVRGNPAYQRIDPNEITIVSTEATRARLAEDEPALLVREAQQIEAKIAAAKGDRKTWMELVGYRAQLKAMKVVLPSLTFDKSLVLRRGARDIYLLFLGRGHTDGDAVVYLPKEKIVITGDLVSGWGPGMNDGYPNEWPATLDQLAKLDIETVIGGHGPPGGKEMIARLRAYLVDLVVEVKAVVARGGTEEQALRSVMERIVPKHRASFAAGEFDLRVPANVTKVHADVKAGKY